MEAGLVGLWETRENVGGRWAESRFRQPNSDQPSVREVHPDPGFAWHGRWQLDCTLRPVDDHGWQYFQRNSDSWDAKRRGSKTCRRRWVRLQVRVLAATSRPVGTGQYKFQLLTIFENQRLGRGRFTSSALEVADHPAFSDALGGLSPERWMTSGLVGETRYCAWRSTWKPHTQWEYAESFKAPPEGWGPTRDEASAVRRRQMCQVIQLEIIDPAAAAAAREVVAAGDAAALTPNGAPPDPATSTSAAAGEAAPGDDAAAAEAAGAAGDEQAGEGGDGAREGAAATVTLADLDIPEPLEWAWTDMELPIGVDALNDAISRGDSRLLAEMNAHRKVTNFEATEWTGTGVGRTREVRYVMAKTAMVKATPASEVQRYSVWAPGVAYAVERLQSAPKLPYGSTFQSQLRDVIVATSPTTTRMRSSIQLVWSSSPLAKSMIVNGARKGSKEAFGEMAAFIRDWIAKNVPQQTHGAAASASAAAAADADDAAQGSAEGAAEGEGAPPLASEASTTEPPATPSPTPNGGGGGGVLSPVTPATRHRVNPSVGSVGSAASLRPVRSTVEWVDGHGVDVCQVCNDTRFTFLSRQHHCRFCGRVVCGGCSGHRKWLPAAGRNERCCDDCVSRPVAPLSASIQADSASLASAPSTPSHPSGHSAAARANTHTTTSASGGNGGGETAAGGSAQLPRADGLQPDPLSEVSSLASVDPSGVGRRSPARTPAADSAQPRHAPPPQPQPPQQPRVGVTSPPTSEPSATTSPAPSLEPRAPSVPTVAVVEAGSTHGGAARTASGGAAEGGAAAGEGAAGEGAAAAAAGGGGGEAETAWMLPHSPMSLNELRRLHQMIDIYTEDSMETLHAILRACTFEAADLIARIHDIESSPAWDEWCTDPREKLFLVSQWERAVVLAVLIVDDASSRIEYHPANTAAERDAQRQTRAATEAFLTSHKQVICRLATTFEIPQFLGVLSLLGEQHLAYKSMWRSTIDRAIETANVHVIADNLKRFVEDEKVKTFEHGFYENNVRRLREHLERHRVKELLECMTENDVPNAHATICHLIRDGLAPTPGSVHALLESPAYRDEYTLAKAAMARRFVDAAEGSAITSMESHSAQRPRSQQPGTPRSQRSKSPATSRKFVVH